MNEFDFDKTVVGLGTGQRVFDRYTLVEILGRGGMGVVWLARDEKLGRELAMKFLPEVLALDPRAVEDLKRETRRALELTHANIVRIYDFVEDARSAAITMEYVKGEPLSKLALARLDRIYSPEDLRPLLLQLCEALAYAHTKAKVVHRDLKPANLMINVDGELKVTDFGISATISDTATRVSRMANISGTPVYMSPQQMMGKLPAATDDIYSLGAMVYELLTGRPPFYTGNLIAQVQGKVPPSMTERRGELGVKGASIPRNWEDTIAACLAKEPEERPASAAEVAQRLTEEKPAPGRRWLPERKPKKKAEPEPVPKKKEERPAPAPVAAPVPVVAPAPTAPAPVARPPTPAAPPVAPQVAPPESAPADEPTPKPRKPRKLLIAGLVAGGLVAAGLGYYFGVYVPAQRELAEARLEAQRAEEARKAEEKRLADERAAAEARRLANARGGLVLRTNPAGADIEVGGVGNDKSPATFKELRLGSYKVTVSKPGYEPQSLKLQVEENKLTQPEAIVLRPIVGAATLATDPAGADYTVTSEKLVAAGLPAVQRTGKTPANLAELPIGSYRLTFRRERWPELTSTVEVKAGNAAQWRAEFVGGGLSLTSEPSAGHWAIKSAPPGVTLATSTGVTPYTFDDLPPGTYQVEVTRDGGWAPVTGTVEVKRGETAKWGASFSGGRLRVASDPPGANWTIKSTPPGVTLPITSGQTPHVFEELPPGRYEVELIRDGGWAPVTRTMEVKRGELARWTEDLVGGGLSLTSDPLGAHWSIKNAPPGVNLTVKAGQTPYTFPEVPVGKYQVEFTRDGGWDPVVKNVEVVERAEFSVEADFAAGTLRLTTDPEGSNYTIKGGKGGQRSWTGTTPANLTLPVGRYEVTFAGNAGWAPAESTVEVTAGRQTVAHAESAPGSLKLTSTPTGAEVWLKGERVGTTPYQATSITPGRYEYELRFNGYKPTSRQIDVAPNQAAQANVALEKMLFSQGENAIVPGLDLKMIWVAPGSFTMGSSGSANEQPAHDVTLTKGYWLEATEVTQGQWTSVMGSKTTVFKGPDHPVDTVSWYQAMEFCQKLTAQERAAGRLPDGLVYTLPTEAQWEYACRAGATGNLLPDTNSVSWYSGNAQFKTHPVTQKQANDWGFYDMLGNVSEWCLDWYGSYTEESATDPTGPLSGTARVIRGGSWLDPADHSRPTFRASWDPNKGSIDLGFRVVVTTPGATP